MFNIKVAFLLLGLMAVIVFGSTPFSDCGSAYTLEDVDIEGCDQLPCVLIPGTKKTVHFKIFARSVSQHLTQYVTLRLRGIYTELEVSPVNPCDQIVCPVTSKHNASFTAVMDLDNEDLTAQLDGELLWKVKNDKNVDVMCMYTYIYVKFN